MNELRFLDNELTKYTAVDNGSEETKVFFPGFRAQTKHNNAFLRLLESIGVDTSLPLTTSIMFSGSVEEALKATREAVDVFVPPDKVVELDNKSANDLFVLLLSGQVR